MEEQFVYPLAYPINISRVRTMLMCGNAYKHLYLDRHSRHSGASGWYGSLIHAMLRLLAYGLPLKDAHSIAWKQFCGEIVGTLAHWYALDSAYTMVGRPTTIAAKKWRREEHPEYDELLEEIEVYQQKTMTHIRWGQTTLAHYYRQSCRLLDRTPRELLPEGLLLVEGKHLGDEKLAPGEMEDEEVAHGEEEDEEKGHDYQLLSGMLYEIPLNGVPDLVARTTWRNLKELTGEKELTKGKADGEEVQLILDRKTGKKTPRHLLERDGQLLLYYHLTLQNGVIDPSLPTIMGHNYLQEDGGVDWNLVGTDKYEESLPLIYKQFRTQVMRIAREEFDPVAGVLSYGVDRCKMCDVAHVCPYVRE